MDDDRVQEVLEFRWNCTDEVGADCMSSSSAVLDLDSFAAGGLLIIPADTLPSGTLNTDVRDIGANTEEDAAAVVDRCVCPTRLSPLWHTYYIVYV